jgi:hypothetical protein
LCTGVLTRLDTFRCESCPRNATTSPPLTSKSMRSCLGSFFLSAARIFRRMGAGSRASANVPTCGKGSFTWCVFEPGRPFGARNGEPLARADARFAREDCDELLPKREPRGAAARNSEEEEGRVREAADPEQESEDGRAKFMASECSADALASAWRACTAGVRDHMMALRMMDRGGTERGAAQLLELACEYRVSPRLADQCAPSPYKSSHSYRAYLADDCGGRARLEATAKGEL